MARKIKRTARRHRALAMLSVLAVVAGTTLAMTAVVGAEEAPTPAGIEAVDAGATPASQQAAEVPAPDGVGVTVAQEQQPLTLM